MEITSPLRTLVIRCYWREYMSEEKFVVDFDENRALPCCLPTKGIVIPNCLWNESIGCLHSIDLMGWIPVLNLCKGKRSTCISLKLCSLGMETMLTLRQRVYYFFLSSFSGIESVVLFIYFIFAVHFSVWERWLWKITPQNSCVFKILGTKDRYCIKLIFIHIKVLGRTIVSFKQNRRLFVEDNIYAKCRGIIFLSFVTPRRINLRDSM